ncbi:MAG: DUF2608 domain-containing protein [Waddliaceae bacterium]|jgi:hypothetical protein|nr:DUF2608 domain-containing protein [Waddliaceae bacterium]MBT3579277.1 DUF2608 domain-containing protein [Waddliaceae bacterium]MBT4445593.1 DUF2608 domain-containing protein [Waddliaceae bacterium]MBT6928454.1 DUF2608 domain-containing protein [Waddliaceae bacterium]MBT7264100.1 DUF2608 domain-containing protein [Waddliaceae bacterium]
MWHKRLLAVILSFFCATLSADIIEMPHMEELVEYVNDDTLVVFDIDNTIAIPVQTLGCDHWFFPHYQEYCDSGMGKEEALTKALLEWMAIQSVSEVTLVEEGIDDVIVDLQTRDVAVMAMTTRGHWLELATRHQLSSLGVDIAKTSPSTATMFFSLERPVMLSDGVIFTNNTHKGNALFTVLDSIEYSPASVIFINDKASDLAMVADSCEARGVPFIGLRYGYTDEAVNNVDMGVAGVQFERFINILSDEEAIALKR